VTVRKYLILLAVVIFGSCGDVCLGRGMRDLGAVTSANWRQLLTVLWNPWVITGICLLILFFCTTSGCLLRIDICFSRVNDWPVLSVVVDCPPLARGSVPRNS